jgi:pimeloyl-ACP methyl ester carboxylesterase
MLHSALSGDYLLEGLLPALERPPLVIFGAKDRVVPPAVGQAMVHDAPGSTYVEIPSAGHLVVYERPEAVADAIDRYLRQPQPEKTAPSNGSS